VDGEYIRRLLRALVATGGPVRTPPGKVQEWTGTA
jgi:hypothetical protein